jgi:hypothetical protein
MRTLYDAIKANLSEQIRNALSSVDVPAKGLKVVVLAGNGLTRLAGYTFGIGGQFLAGLCRRRLEGS